MHRQLQVDISLKTFLQERLQCTNPLTMWFRHTLLIHVRCEISISQKSLYPTLLIDNYYGQITSK